LNSTNSAKMNLRIVIEKTMAMRKTMKFPTDQLYLGSKIIKMDYHI